MSSSLRQVGFSAIMRKISFPTSVDSFFLPTCFVAFKIKLQYGRKSARCQRTTVSGLTSTRDCFQAPQKRRANTQKILSTAPIHGLGCLRFTASCCRRTRFSRSRRRCDCNRRVSRPHPSPILSQYSFVILGVEIPTARLPPWDGWTPSYSAAAGRRWWCSSPRRFRSASAGSGAGC
jgi:hypothetical protein